MSQIQTRDTNDNAIKLVNYTVSLSENPDEPYIDDFFTDYAGNSSWPRLGFPTDKPLYLHVNYFSKQEDYSYQKVEVPVGYTGDIKIILNSVIKPLGNLYIENDHLMVDGKRFVIIGTSNYMLGQYEAEGDSTNRLYRGPNFARLFCTHFYISQQVGLKGSHPDNYGMSNWLDANERAIDKCNANGQYVQANLICDNQVFGKDANFLRDLQNRFIEMFKNKKGIYSLGNENQANGFNANDFDKPSGVISACGSGLTGGEAPLSRGQAWDLQHQHLRRDEKMFIDIPPMDAPTYYINHKLIFDETIGFANYDSPGKRSSNKLWAGQIGRIASAFNGAIIHIDSASHSAPLNNVEQDCLDTFVEWSKL